MVSKARSRALGGFLDGFYSVNKETGEMLGFAPWEETDFLEQTTDMSVWD